jgi:hypothetical protein
MPRPGRGHWLHLLRLGQPLLNRQFVKVFRPGAAETPVVEEELDCIAVAGSGAARDRLKIPLRQWPKPTPLLAKRPAGAGCDLFNRGFAGEKRTGERAQQRRVSHDKTTAKSSNESHPA